MLEPILTERLPPAIAAHLAYVIRAFGADPTTEPSPTFLVELESAYDEGEDEYSRAPELAELGLRLVQRENHPTLRKWGCIWLTLFPSLETVRAMRAIIEDPVEPLALRDQAVWTLGFRQLGTRHDTLFWAPEVVRAADEGLVTATRLDEKRELEQLCLACRHSDDEALDVYQLAAFVTTADATPSVHAAMLLFAKDRGPEAFEALTNGLGHGGEDWQKEKLKTIKPHWQKAKLDVPFEFNKSSKKALDALQSGKAELALRCLRWCTALDDESPDGWRNLGIAQAMLGQTFEAIRAFSTADPKDGPKLAANDLNRAGHRKDALAIFAYASRWFDDASDHRASSAIPHRRWATG